MNGPPGFIQEPDGTWVRDKNPGPTEYWRDIHRNVLDAIHDAVVSDLADDNVLSFEGRMRNAIDRGMTREERLELNLVGTVVLGGKEAMENARRPGKEGDRGDLNGHEVFKGSHTHDHGYSGHAHTHTHYHDNNHTHQQDDDCDHTHMETERNADGNNAIARANPFETPGAGSDISARMYNKAHRRGRRGAL